MEHLTVAVMAVALTVALMLAGIFYGGKVFTRERERAEAEVIESADFSSVPSAMPASWIVTDSY